MQNAFSEGWWDDFLSRTSGMSEPAIFQECLDRSKTERMRMLVMDIMRDLHTKYRTKYGYRLWVDGKRATDEEFIFSHAPLADERLEQWNDRVFNEKKFGIILNRGEKFNDELSTLVSQAVSPLIKKVGMPTEGLLFTIFIGNYDSTPLGIHKDLPGKSVMHFHLGPGDKTMYTWDDEEYLSHTRKVHNNTDVQPHLHYAEKHTFGEGDIYFMPENRFHLGTQSGLSIAIACWWNNRSNQDFAHGILKMAGDGLIASSTKMLKADSHDPADTSALDRTLQLYSAGCDIEKHSFADVLRLTYLDLRHALFSNGGLRNAPLPQTEEVEIDKDSIVRIAGHFRMLMRVTPDADKMLIYVRGSQLEMRNLPSIRRMVDHLNAGDAISIRKLQEVADMDVDAVLFLAKKLIQCKGVHVHLENTPDPLQAH